MGVESECALNESADMHVELRPMSRMSLRCGDHASERLTGDWAVFGAARDTDVLWNFSSGGS